MSLALDIKDRLVAQGVGAFGTTLFVGSRAVLTALGATAGAGPFVNVIETGGAGYVRTQGTTVLTRPTAQIVARALNYAIARAKAVEAMAALGGPMGLFNVTLSGTTYLSVVPRTQIADIGVDEVGRVMMAFHIDAQTTQ